MNIESDFSVLNIRQLLEEDSREQRRVKQLICSFACPRNPDVERFFLEQSIDFTKRNQSVTYLVKSIAMRKLAGYFTLAIKPISVNANLFSNTMRRKIERVAQVNEQTGEYLVAAFLIAQLAKNFNDRMNECITGKQLLDLAVDKVRALQYMAGGTVVFLEADNVDKLIAFYKAKLRDSATSLQAVCHQREPFSRSAQAGAAAAGDLAAKEEHSPTAAGGAPALTNSADPR